MIECRGPIDEAKVIGMTDVEPSLPREARRAMILLYASVQFVVLTAIAMVVYPGGAVYELDSTRYLFLRNFFSDLGATTTPSKLSNLTSHILFFVALASVGLALILASSNWRVIVRRRQSARAAGVATQALEIVAGLGFVGIAATPWNLVLYAHNTFVRLAFGFLLLYDICLLIIQLGNAWPPLYTTINAIYLLLLLAYVGILFFGPRMDTQHGLEFQVAAQKIIVYTSILASESRRFPSGVKRELQHELISYGTGA